MLLRQGSTILAKTNAVSGHHYNRARFSQLGLTFNQGVNHQKKTTSKVNTSSNGFISAGGSSGGIENSNRFKLAFNNLTKHIRFRPQLNDELNGGIFNNKMLTSASGFVQLAKRAESRVNALVNEANEKVGEGGARGRKLVQIFDDMSNELCCVADAAEFVRTTHPDPVYRNQADETYAQISRIVERLNTNRPLYIKLKDSLNNDSHLDECDKRVCRLLLADFEQSGIHLDDEARNRFVHVNDELVTVLMQFQINSQAPSVVRLADVDPRLRATVERFNIDPIKVETNFISSEDENLREFVYRSYLGPNPVQESFFQTILQKRKEIAQLCGFETYSHRANANMILQTPAAVMSFLKECSQLIATKANSEFDLLRRFKREAFGSNRPLMPWDVPFLSNRLKSKLFDVDKSQYMPYFSIGSCMEGINMILNQVYNVNLEIENCAPGELWSRDVYKLAVKDAKQGVLGYIYCDFYQRENKFSNVDCHFTVQCSKQMPDGSFQLPIVVLHLNFPPSMDQTPTLLSFEMMENLFHEFGHAIHSMFAKTRYQHVSGTRCSTDLAEVPSQLMEHYCRDVRVLKKFARHYVTLEPIDERVVDKLCSAKKYFAASDLQAQVLSSALDQAFHLLTPNDSIPSAHDLMRKYTKEFQTLPYVENTNWHLRFNHLVGYGARYYSYLVSKAIAARIWSQCFEKDPLSPSAGEMYRKKLLEYGGEKRPEELIRDLLGHDVDPKAMVTSLTKDLN